MEICYALRAVRYQLRRHRHASTELNDFSGDEFPDRDREARGQHPGPAHAGRAGAYRGELHTRRWVASIIRVP